MRFKGAIGRYRKPSGAGVVPAAIVLPTLTLTGALSFTTSSVAGTLVANIGNVPAGVTPTLTPNDGRLAIAGSAGAWTVVTGLSASSAGSFTLTVIATGANSASAIVTITAASSSAQITSAPSQTQPGATQRYYQATADRPGTWAISSGATMDAASGIWSLDSNNTGDGSAQTTRTPTLTFTPTDGTGAVAQPVTVTLTAIAAPSSSSISYASDFSGAAGTPLYNKPGWAISRDSDAGPIGYQMLTGDGRLTGYDGNYGTGGTWAILYSPAGDGKGSRLEYRVGPSTIDRVVFLFTNATDWKNGLLLGFLIRNGTMNCQQTQSYDRQNNVNTALAQIPPDSERRADGSISLVVDTATDGASVTVSIIGAVTKTITYPLTGTHGTNFGFSALSAGAPAMEGGTFLQSINFVKPAVVLAMDPISASSANNMLTATGTWSGVKPIALQHRLYDDDTGAPATAWMTGDTVVTGTTSGTVSTSVTAPRKGTFRVRFRPLNDTAVEIIGSSPTAFFANIITFQQGYNVRSANYFQPVPMLTNAGVYGEVAAGQIALPYDGIDGFANVVSTPGTNFLAFTNGIDEIVSQNTSAGTLRVRFRDGPAIQNRIITFNGTTPTKFEITRDGLGLIAPEWLAGMEGAEVIRDLDMTLQNFIPENLDVVRTRNTPADGFYRNDIGVGPNAPYQDRVRAAAAYAAFFPGFKSWWSVLDVDMTDAEITAKATFERDFFPPDKNLLLQFGNEIHWNTDFSGVRRVALDGLRNGHYGASSPTSPMPGLNIIGEGGGHPGTTPSGPFASVKTTHAIQANDYITANVYSVGNVVYRAKQFAPVGTYIADGTTDAQGNVTSVSENAYFTKDLSKDLVTASRRWEVVRFNQIIEIYRSVFGATRFAAQIKPLLMGQAGGTLYAQMAVARDYMPGFFDKIWGVGNAFYFTPEGTYDGSSATAASLEASFRAQMPIIKAATVQTVVDAIRMGKVPCFYEGFDHNDGTYGRPGRETYTTAWDARQNSDVGRQFLSDVAYFMKTNVPGVVCGYDLAAGGVWSLKKGWRDTANKRLVGWREGLARTS